MNQSYTRTAKFLHWLVAFGLIATFCVGFYMEGLALSPEKLKLYSWHKWAGISLFILIAIRLAWRISHPAPALPDTMKPIEKFMAHVGHNLLYALMLVIPISGWLMSSALGVSVVWFGILPLPDLVQKDDVLGELLLNLHVILNYTLLVAVIGHIAAALQHHFVKKDQVLKRMLPFTGKT